MSPKMYTLVKWIGGQDDKKYTPDVPVSWIKGFNIEDFESDTFDPSLSYVIEWHSTKKIPPGGWPVHDGYVIAVSRSIATLQNKLKALDGLLSPKSKTPEIEHSASTQSGSGSNDEKNKTCKPKATISGPIDGGSNEESTENVDRGENTGKSANSNSLKPKPGTSLDKKKRAEDKRNRQSNDSDRDSLDGRFTNVSGCSRLKRKRTSTQLYKDNSENQQEGSVARALTPLRKEIKLLRKKRSDSSDSSASDEDEKKEIGRRGSGIFLSNAMSETARSTKSYTAMGISLMMSLFPIKVLLASHLRGGRCKIPAAKEGPNRPALNQKIIDALYYAVQKKWKKSFNKSGLGIALNSKLTHLRVSKKKNRSAEEHSE